ncbi:MAG TPA: EscU/YscU/HrcU family type III secretion system export apparatus switch protein [Treponemataceae bacterium]|nr:EscU/YscU/HrcU family type III secretion system export apparatus switch protein [Treponemataceae bacterium]
MRKTASALSYRLGMRAPLVTAKGSGRVAERMLEIAREHGIEIVEDPALAFLIDGADVGAEIPEDAYEAVAAVFAFLERGIRERWFQKVR